MFYVIGITRLEIKRLGSGIGCSKYIYCTYLLDVCTPVVVIDMVYLKINIACVTGEFPAEVESKIESNAKAFSTEQIAIFDDLFVHVDAVFNILMQIA